MKSVLIHYPVNFWEANPEFLVHPTFKEFSKNKASNNIMWAFAFVIERRDNMYIELPMEERKKIVVTEIISDKSFSWKKYDEIFNLYKELRTTSIDRQIEALEKKLKDREEFLNDTEYSLETAKLLDGLLVSTEGLIDKVLALKAKLESDGEDVGTVQGGMTESFLESE